MRDWLIHAVQIPKEYAQILFQASVTGLDFKSLVEDEEGKALYVMITSSSTASVTSSSTSSSGVSSDLKLHIEISVKRIVRAMKLILLG